MHRPLLIGEIVHKLKKDAAIFEIDYFLTEHGVHPSEFNEIKEQVQAQLLAERQRLYAKRNKMIFIVWSVVSVVSFVCFVFIFPYTNIFEFSTLLSITGAAIICFSLFNVLAYSNTWKPSFLKVRGKPKIDYGFIVILAVPAVLFAFLISWRFDAGAKALLKKDKREATGTILSGSSQSSKSFDFTSVVVAFKTQNGESIEVTKDISSYDFTKFYVGQKIQLVYSESNPHNIDLLIHESDMRNIMGSAEREITPADLLSVMDLGRDSLLPHLNEISYGWAYDTTSLLWKNDRKLLGISMSQNEITFITAEMAMHTFPPYFEKMGFKQTNPNEKIIFAQKEKIFEKPNYKAIIAAKHNQNQTFYIVTILKYNR